MGKREAHCLQQAYNILYKHIAQSNKVNTMRINHNNYIPIG